MGLDVRDKDWVVVGATAEEMTSLGFIKVGADFPVFLHPETKQEYSLARTERKTAPGYRGFVVHADKEVTLDEDLSRRDLTMNAVAMAEDGSLRDPFGGVADIERKVLRHVSEAFKEDPVRVLRIARFAARFEDFTVAEETMSLMKAMVNCGEVDSLVAERVWRELEKGLMERAPWRMLEVLEECGALERVMPELSAMVGISQPLEHHPEDCCFEHVKLVLKEAAKAGADASVRFSCLVHDLGKGATPKHLLPRHIGHEAASARMVAEVVKRLKVPSEMGVMAGLVAQEHTNVHASIKLNGKAALRLIERCDGIRRHERFRKILQACELDAKGRLGLSDLDYPQRRRMEVALEAALKTDVASVAQRMMEVTGRGEAIGGAIRHARGEAVQAALDQFDAAESC
jgi:tRNA nucleotidyltransferase (CCA-adding enzyme)